MYPYRNPVVLSAEKDKPCGGRDSLQNFQNLVIGDQRLVACMDSGKFPFLYPSAQGAFADPVALLHMEEYAKINLQPGTATKYAEELNDKILPALGHLKLSELKPHIINAFFSIW